MSVMSHLKVFIIASSITSKPFAAMHQGIKIKSPGILNTCEMSLLHPAAPFSPQTAVIAQDG